MTRSQASVSNGSALREPVKEHTVLLVDDDSRLLRGLERSFDNEAFNVLTAISPAEAHVILAKERVDLVLSDNLMTGALGTEFLEQVRTQYPNIKLMMLSGYIPATAAKRVISHTGVIAVLTKPCKAADVANAIRRAFRSPAS